MCSVVLDIEIIGMLVIDGYWIIEIGCVELEGCYLIGCYFYVYL